MRTLSAAALLAVMLCFVGCDVDVYEDTPPGPSGPSTPITDPNDGVSVEIDPIGESRAERREERLENLRDAVGDVDVQVGEDGVKVDVEDKSE